MSGTESEKKPAKARGKVKVDENARDMYLLTLPPYELGVNEIAERFQMHPVTCSKKIAAVRELMAPVYEAQRKNFESMKQTAVTDPRAQTNGGAGGEVSVPKGSLPEPLKENPFAGLKTFMDAVTPSVQAGMVVGSSIALIGESFNKKKHPVREDRYEMVAKGAMTLGPIIMSILETIENLSPAEDELVEYVEKEQ